MVSRRQRQKHLFKVSAVKIVTYPIKYIEIFKYVLCFMLQETILYLC